MIYIMLIEPFPPFLVLINVLTNISRGIQKQIAQRLALMKTRCTRLQLDLKELEERFSKKGLQQGG
jgi:hypothetical protein